MTDVVQNAAAGLLVALLLWIARRVRARWRQRRPRSSEPPTYAARLLMPGPLRKPDLPPGHHRELIDLLHDLRARANYRPSFTDIRAATGLSRTTLYAALCDSRFPSKDVVALLAGKFAERISWRDRDQAAEEMTRIDKRVAWLWDQAQCEFAPPAPDSVTAAIRAVWDDFASGAMPPTHVPPEVAAALLRSTFAGTKVGPTSVCLFAEAPDAEAYFTLDGQTEASSNCRWQEQFEIAVSRRIGHLVDIVVWPVEAFDTDSA